MTFQRRHAAVSRSSAAVKRAEGLSRDDHWYVCSGPLCKHGGATWQTPSCIRRVKEGLGFVWEKLVLRVCDAKILSRDLFFFSRTAGIICSHVNPSP